MAGRPGHCGAQQCTCGRADAGPNQPSLEAGAAGGEVGGGGWRVRNQLAVERALAEQRMVRTPFKESMVNARRTMAMKSS